MVINRMLCRLLWATCLFVLLPVTLPAAFDRQAQAADELNCLLCHKYRGLSRIDEDGRFRLFYINEDMHERGPHAKVMCIDCHADIDEIPHRPAEKVDCTQECHLREPSSGRYFSHSSVKKILDGSAHSRFEADGSLKPHQEDYPGCKDCHDEPLYRLDAHHGPGTPERSIARCESCHEEGGFAQTFFTHVSARMQQSRAPRELVEMCARCHADPGIQERHGLHNAVKSFQETYHWKAMRFGNEEVADCVDCHVVSGESVHLIESQHTPTSAVAPGNVASTCRSSGCHETAGENLAGYRVHVVYDPDEYPVPYYLKLFFKVLKAGVMYFFLPLIFLELIRRLFPRFSFFKH